MNILHPRDRKIKCPVAPTDYFRPRWYFRCKPTAVVGIRTDRFVV